MTTIFLHEYKDLFKNEAAYLQFVAVFKDVLEQNTMPIVLSDKELLFTAVSPEAAKEMFAGQILQRLWDNPNMLDEIQSRLEEDEIVDGEPMMSEQKLSTRES